MISHQSKMKLEWVTTFFHTKKTNTTHLSHLLAPSSAICSDPPQAYDSFFSDIDNKQIKGQAQS
jgi:hypothetical protein